MRRCHFLIKEKNNKKKIKKLIFEMNYVQGKNLSEIIRKGEGGVQVTGKKLFKILIRAITRL